MSARRESNWWMLTAKSDLHAARVLADASVFHLCAFHAQQGAEKALKAVLTARGKSHRTHACTTLFGTLAELGVDVPAELSSAGRRLDLHYIQSRYPNGLGGDPTEYYDAAIAEDALELAESILRFARRGDPRVTGAGPEESPPSSPPAIVDRLLRCLRALVELEALVLFGSRARDDAFDESDWDFAVISSDFQGLDPLARARLTVDCRLPLVDLVHLTPEELLEPDSSYLRCAILEEGRTIVDAGGFARARDRYAARKSAGEISFHDALVDASPGAGS